MWDKLFAKTLTLRVSSIQSFINLYTNSNISSPFSYYTDICFFIFIGGSLFNKPLRFREKTFLNYKHLILIFWLSLIFSIFMFFC